VLGYFEGLSSSEIASKIGVPIGTVKSRVAAALSALRQALADQQGVA
jgi:RNA polymerase sigma-70 factor (ECF subfamily)